MADVVFITAGEAYSRSVQSYESQLRKNREEVRDLIFKATELGEFKVIYDRPLHPVVVTWLMNNYGYNVTKRTLDHSKKEVWVISWEHAG